MTATPGFLSVSISFDDESEALTIAAALVEARLAACVQVHPITSVYRWDGKIADADELIITAKTTAARFDALCELVRAGHSYDVPEIIGTPITHIDPGYATWLRDETSEN